MSNVYRRYARAGTHHHRPVIEAYNKKFSLCEVFNRQIIHRILPQKHRGKGARGERSKQDSFAFEGILLYTFYAYRNINDIANIDYD